ncbi:MAG: tetratricopeptide repeat protein [Ahrensia sp.]|nr:tetratricopeptide repeat protein [Ahrensia sp.]
MGSEFVTDCQTNGKGRQKRLLSVLSVGLLCATIAGCATDGRSTGSINRGGKPVEQMTAGELAQSIDSYRALYDRDPKNKSVAMAYASILRANNMNEQALAVMRKAAIVHSSDRDVLAAYGKALAGASEFSAALDALQRAQDPTRPDWRLISAEGAIYDQTGRSEEARSLYQKALGLRPNEPTILSNLAMSHVLENDLVTAENYLRTAVQQPAADSRVRQNLAMVVGLQGRFDEAMDIAKRELSPQQAEANVAYLRTILSQQNAWSLIKKEDQWLVGVNQLTKRRSDLT